MLFKLHTCLQWIFVCGYNYIYKRKGKEATERNPEGREGGREGGREEEGREGGREEEGREGGREVGWKEEGGDK